jgi:hypothetical protein
MKNVRSLNWVAKEARHRGLKRTMQWAQLRLHRYPKRLKTSGGWGVLPQDAEDAIRYLFKEAKMKQSAIDTQETPMVMIEDDPTPVRATLPTEREPMTLDDLRGLLESTSTGVAGVVKVTVKKSGKEVDLSLEMMGNLPDGTYTTFVHLGEWEKENR